MSNSDRMRCASCRGAFLSLISGAALKRVIANLMREAEQRLDDGDVGVDRCGLGRRAVEFDPDRLECGLHVVERGASQIDAGRLEGIEEAAADPPIGPHSVVRAVDVRLEPDREQLEVGSRRRLQRRLALGVGAGDLRTLRRYDFKFGACHRVEPPRQQKTIGIPRFRPIAALLR